jgi:type II secretory pathway pseudopilin PulG
MSNEQSCCKGFFLKMLLDTLHSEDERQNMKTNHSRHAVNHRINESHASGLTLIEVMIATTITLLMMLALAKGFQALSKTVSEGRSRLGLSDQLRGINELLRSDLQGLTTDGSSPQSAQLPRGYFKYYDGPISDPTATLFNNTPPPVLPTPPIEIEKQIPASRWGDIDDIAMFTAKAKPGTVFRGKIPQALLVLNAINKGLWSLPPPSAGDWAGFWNTDVTISSDYAEIVWFMLPLNEFNSIDITSPDYMVFDVGPSDGMPDRIALCRRVLLIRPDLDVALNSTLVSTYFGPGSTTDRYLWMQPLEPSTANTNTFRFMMQYPYQRCDLSVRPQLVSTGSGSFISAQTNSIESLQIPDNRFAHYGYPVGGEGTNIPQLALSSEYGNANAAAYLTMTNPVYAGILDPTLPNFHDRGFLPSCFMRTKNVAVAGVGLVTKPTLEEILSADVVSFDLQGFDISVKQLGHPGRDGNWGDGTTDKTRYGLSGWDDLSLTPSDPGYATWLAKIALQGTTNQVVSGAGAFVDVGWGSKVVNSNHPTSVGPIRLSALTNPQLLNISGFLQSNLSMTRSDLRVADSAIDSGAFFGSADHVSYQPSFDTFTNAYDFDGTGMLKRTYGTYDFSVYQGGLLRLGIGVGGALGDDSIFPFTDTRPPVSAPMPSIQATIRVQDFTAGTLQQISVVHDLNN